MDRRWQLVLDCLDAEHAPFGKRTLVRFRQAIIAHDLDRRLIEQTVNCGSARLRERTAVEHTLAHIGQWQGRDAQYIGQRKDLFDVRRTAAVQNLHVLLRQPQRTDEAAA